MIRIIFCLAFFSQLALAEVTLVPWSSPEGVKRLERSSAKTDFFPLVNNFEGQTNKAFCGPATVTIVLNALRIRSEKTLPLALYNLDKEITDSFKSIIVKMPEWTPFYTRYSQENIFEGEPEKVKTKAQVLGVPMPKTNEPDFGFQLRQLHAFVQKHSLKSEIYVIDDQVKKEEIKSKVVKNLKSSGDHVIVNYARKSLGQPGGGHISPLGAYDAESDSFLILDVTPNKAPFVWVNWDDLFNAMKTHDTVENRGLLLVSENKPS